MSEGSRAKVVIGLVLFISALIFVGMFFKKVDLNETKSSVDEQKLQRENQLRDQAAREQRAIRDKEFREQDAQEQKEKTQLREQREKRDEREHKDKKEQRERREQNEAKEAEEKKEQRRKREEQDESEAKEKRERRQKREEREVFLDQQALMKARSAGSSASGSAQAVPPTNPPLETTSALQNRASKFNAIFHGNSWGSKESKSGTGSELSQTINIRAFLAKVFVKYNISTMLDAPCGDFNWQPHIEGIHAINYTGADIVEAAIQHNKQKLANGPEKFKHFNFIVLDVVGTPVGKYDLIHCRDALQHMPLSDAKTAINNFKRSGSTYLMTNFHEGSPGNKDIQPGDMNPINVMMPPFNFPQPMEHIHEHPNVWGLDGTKRMGIWKMQDVPSY